MPPVQALLVASFKASLPRHCYAITSTSIHLGLDPNPALIRLQSTIRHHGSQDCYHLCTSANHRSSDGVAQLLIAL